MKPSRKKLLRINPKAEYITLEELYNEYEFDLQLDEYKYCYYLEDPEDDDTPLTPCFYEVRELEKWINENWDHVSKGLTKRQEGYVEEEDVKRQETLALIKKLKEKPPEQTE